MVMSSMVDYQYVKRYRRVRKRTNKDFSYYTDSKQSATSENGSCALSVYIRLVFNRPNDRLKNYIQRVYAKS